MEWSPGAPAIPPQINPSGVDTALAQATTIITKAEKAAGDLTSAGASILSSALSISIPSILSSILPTIAAVPRAIEATKPTLKDVPWEDRPLPAPFTGTLDIGDLLPTRFTGVAPAMNFDAKPLPHNGVQPTAPGIDLNFAYPTVDVVLPPPPSLLSISNVPWAGIDIPEFDIVIPEFTVIAPSIIAYVEGSFYTSALLTQTRTDLQRALTDGTWTGLATDAERGLWERARERELRQQADALASLERMETLGYAFPPGVFIDAQIKIQTETNNTLAGLSREIMIKQAELQLDNVQKCRAMTVQLESKLIDYTNQIAQRSFDATKMVNEVAVQIYNGQVEAYKARVEVYRWLAQAYEARVRGELAKVEAFKAQVEAEHLKVEVNNSLVNQFKVQTDAALAQIEIFKGKIQIIQTQAQIEKLKIDAYQAQIQAYIGEINIFSAEVEAYKVGVQAEATKQQAFATQVQAFAAEVDAGAKLAQAKIEEFKGLISAKTEEIEAFKAGIQALTAKVQAATALNTGLIDEYKADVAADSAYNELLTKQWEAVINSDIRIAEIAVKAAETQQQLALTGRTVTNDAIKGAAQVLGQLGAAALNAVHYSNSVSSSISSSASNSASYSESQTASV